MFTDMLIGRAGMSQGRRPPTMGQISVGVQRISAGGGWVDMPANGEVRPGEQLRAVARGLWIHLFNSSAHFRIFQAATGATIAEGDANVGLDGEAKFVFQVPYYTSALPLSLRYVQIIAEGPDSQWNPVTRTRAGVQILVSGSAPPPPGDLPSGIIDDITGGIAGGVGNLKTLGIIAVVLVGLAVLGPSLAKAIGAKGE